MFQIDSLAATWLLFPTAPSMYLLLHQIFFNATVQSLLIIYFRNVINSLELSSYFVNGNANLDTLLSHFANLDDTFDELARLRLIVKIFRHFYNIGYLKAEDYLK